MNVIEFYGLFLRCLGSEFTMGAFQHKKAVCVSLLVIFCIALTGCRNNNVTQPTPTVDMVRLQNLPPEQSQTPAATTIPADSAPATSTSTPTNTATAIYPPTPEYTATPEPTLTPLPPPFYDTFVASIVNGNASQVVGVYVDEVMVLKVVQQPTDNPAYVSTLEDTATYFAMVEEITGNTGLLAHNYLAGIYYYDLQPGQIVMLIYGDGSTEEYIVSESDEFQALNPESATSSFVDLSTGETLTSTDLFYRVYGGSSRTTFQTCIAQGSEDSWGRLFVISPQE
jgi:hypothetical protein